MDNDNIHDVTYRFKICVSLDDDENALIYLERLVNYIEEYGFTEFRTSFWSLDRNFRSY